MSYLTTLLIVTFILYLNSEFFVTVAAQRGRKRSRNGNLAQRRREMREKQRQNRIKQQMQQLQESASDEDERMDLHLTGSRDASSFVGDLPENSSKASGPINDKFEEKLVVVDPPQNSFIQGGNFMVNVVLQVEDEEAFMKNFSSFHVCLSLDEAPWHCWPEKNTRMYFSQVIEGSHSLRAKIFHNESFIEQYSSENISFKVVTDPNFEPANITTEDENDLLDLDQSDSETVSVHVPKVQIQSPIDKITHRGTSIEFRSHLRLVDVELFQQYFNHSFICVNLDAAAGHTCFPIFGYLDNMSPLIVDVSAGFHTFEASIMNPQTKDLIEVSSSGTITFFTSGSNDEAAAFSTRIIVDDEARYIPVVSGSDYEAQAASFCSSIFLANDHMCIETVHQKLLEDMKNIL